MLFIHRKKKYFNNFQNQFMSNTNRVNSGALWYHIAHLNTIPTFIITWKKSPNKKKTVKNFKKSEWSEPPPRLVHHIKHPKFPTVFLICTTKTKKKNTLLSSDRTVVVHTALVLLSRKQAVHLFLLPLLSYPVPLIIIARDICPFLSLASQPPPRGAAPQRATLTKPKRGFKAFLFFCYKFIIIIMKLTTNGEGPLKPLYTHTAVARDDVPPTDKPAHSASALVALQAAPHAREFWPGRQVLYVYMCV